MSVPPFSPWTRWTHRSSLDARRGPGVYLLARFEEGPPPVPVEPDDRRIVLIAETHDQTLEARWRKFDYCAFRGGDGHAGGRTFYKLFNNGTDATVPHWLYLSACAVQADVTDAGACIQDLKDRLIAEYQERHGTLPCCNLRGPAGTAVAASGTAPGPSSDAAPTPTSTPPVAAASAGGPATFLPWRPWAERDQVDGCQSAGVYALAHFPGGPPAVVDVLDERVVYIGETCDNSLSGRLYQFNRSAFVGKSGHSGGWSYRSRCADAGEHLYVALLPVAALAEPHRSAFIRHTERRLLWEYVSRWGRRPLCNSK